MRALSNLKGELQICAGSNGLRLVPFVVSQVAVTLLECKRPVLPRTQLSDLARELIRLCCNQVYGGIITSRLSIGRGAARPLAMTRPLAMMLVKCMTTSICR